MKGRFRNRRGSSLAVQINTTNIVAPKSTAFRTAAVPVLTLAGNTPEMQQILRCSTASFPLHTRVSPMCIGDTPIPPTLFHHYLRIQSYE